MLQWQSGFDARPYYAVAFQDGSRRLNGSASLSFTVSVPDQSYLERLLNSDAYSAALAFVRGEFNISGDIVSAIRILRDQLHPTRLQRLWKAATGFAPGLLESYFQSKARAAEDIRFHYDRSNEFYSKFLDSRLVYSSALFTEPGSSLEQAQSAKLNSICRKLGLQPGEAFLDVGCGWGGLMIYAAEHYRAYASGCTLSRNQYNFAAAAIAAHGLEDRTCLLESDYRNVKGRFRKIASIGMFEHVGQRRLSSYFRTMYNLVEDGGLFLNSGITRPQSITNNPETYFLRKEVFPGGELAHLSDIMRDAENAGFEIVEVESIRQHYARTCREWVARLQNNAESCIAVAGERTYRTWLLYLAASAVNFEEGQTDAYQILMARPSNTQRPAAEVPADKGLRTIP